MNGVTTERIRVRYGETDRMGHAYYGAYLLWFEQARGAWCRERGFTYRGLERRGFFLPVVEAYVRYRDEVLYDDLIEVKVWVSEIRRASIRFDYRIEKGDPPALCTEGFTRHVLTGPEKRALSIPPWLEALLRRDPADWASVDPELFEHGSVGE